MYSNTIIPLYSITVFVLLFILGILLRIYWLYDVPPIAFLCLVAVSACLSLICLRKMWPSNLFSITAIVCLGAYIMSVKSGDLALTAKAEYVKYGAVVLSKPERKGKTLRFDAEIIGVENRKCNSFKVKMAVYSPNQDYNHLLSLLPGDGIECLSVFTKPQARNKSHFNYTRYLQTQGFKAETFVYADNIRKKQLIHAALPFMLKVRLFFSGIRTDLLKLYSQADISGDNLAILSALTLGDKSLLKSDVKDNFSKAGASHILALSGFHLSIIYSLLALLLWRDKRNRLWNICVSTFILLSVWGYVLLVGMPLSAVRSALMLTIYNFISISQRNTAPLNSLSLAALIILLLSPISIFDVGFQLSFIAVAFIMIFYGPINDVMKIERLKYNKPYQWFTGMISVSLAAQYGTAPVVAYYFGRFSCYFLLSNFIAVPLAMILLYSAAAMFILGHVPVCHLIISFVMEKTVSLLNGSLEGIASLPFSSIENIYFSIPQVAAYYIILPAIIHLVRIFVRSRKFKFEDYTFPDRK